MLITRVFHFWDEFIIETRPYTYMYLLFLFPRALGWLYEKLANFIVYALASWIDLPLQPGLYWRPTCSVKQQLLLWGVPVK